MKFVAKIVIIFKITAKKVIYFRFLLILQLFLLILKVEPCFSKELAHALTSMSEFYFIVT